jgi:hypothetical protein
MGVLPVLVGRRFAQKPTDRRMRTTWMRPGGPSWISRIFPTELFCPWAAYARASSSGDRCRRRRESAEQLGGARFGCPLLDLGTPLGQQLLDIAVGQPEAEVPADRTTDPSHLGCCPAAQ